MITWPAMLKYDQDDELFYIADRHELDKNTELHLYEYQPLDVLIDSAGVIYTLETALHHRSRPAEHLSLIDNASQEPNANKEPSGKTIELVAAIALIQAHFSQLGECCAAKISAPSVAVLIHMLGSDHSG